MQQRIGTTLRLAVAFTDMPLCRICAQAYCMCMLGPPDAARPDASVQSPPPPPKHTHTLQCHSVWSGLS